MSKLKYNELANAMISENKRLVISECTKENDILGFTIAQQVDVDESGKTIKVFLKNAIHIDNVEGLYNLRDAINEVIKNVEK